MRIIFEGMGEAKEANYTAFLESILDTEAYSYQNIFDNPLINYDFNKGKILLGTLKINLCRNLFEKVNLEEEAEKEYSPEKFHEGWGFSILELRKRGVSDTEIYERIIESKTKFLEMKDRGRKKKCFVSGGYQTIVNTHQAEVLYGSVKSGLMDLLGSVY